MLRRLFHERRHTFEQLILAMVLPALAGAINASGLFAVGTYTSHVTGTVARIGDELAQGRWHMASRAVTFVGSFIGGAMAATFLIVRARARGRALYWRVLALECALLLVFATANVNSEKRRVGDYLLTALIFAAMGLQNAMVTKISGARIRTTHLTGVSTDIGIELVRLSFWWRERARGMTLRQQVRTLPQLGEAPDFRHLRLHLAIFSSFLTGAIAGPALYLAVGHYALLVPCAVLALLAAVDASLGLTGERPPAAKVADAITVA